MNLRLYLKIGAVAKQLGVTTQTVRNWEKDGSLKPIYVNDKGTRFYTQEQIDRFKGVRVQPKPFKVVGYCRVSSNGQKDDLERQVELVETYIKYRWDNYEMIKDIGSGINYTKRGLKKLVSLIVSNEVDIIVILHKDRLLRFGFELLEYLAELHGVEIRVIENDEDKTDEQELAEDIIQIITVYGAKLNGKRAWENKRLREEIHDDIDLQDTSTADT